MSSNNKNKNTMYMVLAMLVLVGLIVVTYYSFKLLITLLPILVVVGLAAGTIWGVRKLSR